MRSILAIFIATTIPVAAFAHGTKVEMVYEATGAALEMFAKQEAKSTVDSFNAVKGWLSGSQIKVKAYYNSNAESISYVCEMDHSGEEEKMVCVKE